MALALPTIKKVLVKLRTVRTRYDLAIAKNKVLKARVWIGRFAINALRGGKMNNQISHENVNEISSEEILMMAAESSLSHIFDEADNDSQYHRSINSVQDDLVHGQCSRTPEEIAISILAWSGAL